MKREYDEVSAKFTHEKNKKRKRTKSDCSQTLSSQVTEIEDLKKKRDDLKVELDKWWKYTRDMMDNPVTNFIFFIYIPQLLKLNHIN